MKLQNLTVIFIIIILPVILITTLYISTGLKTIEYQSRYDTGLIDATYDAINAFEKNTANIKLSDNPEIKRSIINSSIKMFEKSLCNTCNISSYNKDEIEQYIPAIVFGMYDGFYMYAPSGVYDSVTDTTKYKHNLKNYVYYSETLEGIGQGGTDIVIMYSLDNYVTVCGDFVENPEEVDDEGYITKSGYLTVCEDGYGIEENGKYYKSVEIKKMEARKYYWESYVFTEWFNTYIGSKKDYLNISNVNDPEDPNSPFVQHKRMVIKNKIAGVLNSSITAYSEKTFQSTYKMPKLTEEDLEKIYSNISMITFFQGKKIGFTQYNGYCVLNSTNNNEYVNPNLMYFIEGEDNNTNYYHDIRCEKCKDATTLTGYKIGAFSNRKDETTDQYVYDHQALACYECINAPFSTNQSIYEYIWGLGNSEEEKNIKSAYWTSLARERYTSKRVNAAKIRVISEDGIRIGYYNSIDTALAECKDGYTIEILEELNLTQRLVLGNSKTKNDNVVVPINITIIGKITTTEDIYIFEGATVNMNNMVIKKIDTETNVAINVINNNGYLTINNSTIINESKTIDPETNEPKGEIAIKNRSVRAGDPPLEDGNYPTLTINKSTITNSRTDIAGITILDEEGVVTINNSTISNNTNIASVVTSKGNITINHSTIENKQGTGEVATGVANGGTININNDEEVSD